MQAETAGKDEANAYKSATGGKNASAGVRTSECALPQRMQQLPGETTKVPVRD